LLSQRKKLRSLFINFLGNPEDHQRGEVSGVEEWEKDSEV